MPEYDPGQSHLVHAKSAKLADALYAKAMNEAKFHDVVLLSSGAASGKTEFMSEYLAQQPYIVLDGTLPTFKGASIKIAKAIKRKKHVVIVAVWPADLKVAFAAFLQRERKYPDEHFYKTHSLSRRALLEIAESNLPVDIKLYENHFEGDGLAFYEYEFESKAQLIEKLKDSQYTEQDIIDIITQS